MAVELHCTLFAADGKSILWEGLARGNAGKQQEFKLSTPANDVPADTRAIFRNADGATVSIPGSVFSCPFALRHCWHRIPNMLARSVFLLALLPLQRGDAAGGRR